MKRAAIDVGTNSVRLLVVAEDGTELARETHITRLGQGVDGTRVLQAEAIARTLAVIAQYKLVLNRLDVSALRVTATSAVRDASNREHFCADVRALVGVEPEVLSGTEEATLCFRGATAELTGVPAPYLVFDIGGGSTEFILGKAAPEHAVSLDMGCVRTTERYFPGSQRPTPETLQAAHEGIRTMLAACAAPVPFTDAKSYIGVAGTVTAFAAMASRAERYDPSVTHGFRLTSAMAEELYDELVTLSTAELRLRLLDPKRAGVIVGGAVILLEIFRFFELPEVIVAERDILDGLVLT